MAWCAGAASLNLIAAQLIQGVIILWQPDYDQPRWHVTLLTMAFVFLATLFNTAGVKQLPVWELFTTFIHFFGILIILVPLWVLTPKNTSKDVFKGFGDSGGWGNLGLACVVGQVGPLFALSRADGGSHIGQ
jgi:choline transport protein